MIRSLLSRLPLTLTLGLALFSTGCSTIKFAYNHVDWYAVPKLESYTTFDRAQKKEIRREFDLYMKWHRKTMLPSYAVLLKQLAKTLETPGTLTPDQARLLRLEVLRNYQDTLRPTLAPAARMLATLDSKQLTRLEETLENEDFHFREKHFKGTPEKRMQEREKRTLDFLDDWTGHLSHDQKHRFEAAFRKVPDASSLWMETRRKWRTDLLKVLREKKSALELEAFLASWVLERQAHLTDEQKKQMTELESASDQFASEFAQLLEARQLEHARTKLLHYARIFEELSQEDR